jgi:hypothetical protein
MRLSREPLSKSTGSSELQDLKLDLLKMVTDHGITIFSNSLPLNALSSIRSNREGLSKTTVFSQ